MKKVLFIFIGQKPLIIYKCFYTTGARSDRVVSNHGTNMEYKSTIFLPYYRQLLSTKCIEKVYSLLEKRKSSMVHMHPSSSMGFSVKLMS